MEEKSKEYVEGGDQFKKGYRIYHNPYEKETREFEDWANGWHDAHDQDWHENNL
ncbi:hypothetical protein AWB71_05292 [Caballeronia peredens]|nr:hypothetical protein AWB71_05292 [Caballeronia peredens]